MPTYDYVCETCGPVVEYFQGIKDAPLERCPKDVCPRSGKEKGNGIVHRRIGAGGGVMFTGSGFYITDYKKKKGDGGPKKSE